MHGDASTIPLDRDIRAPRGPSRAGERVRVAAASGSALAAAALAAIVLLSLLLVIITADRPSGLAPTTHANFYPAWMAGPLAGLWPGLTSNGTELRWIFTIALVAMYVCYALLLRRSTVLDTRWVIAAIVAVELVFLIAPPMALTDVFNYINYGRMEIVHHLNPYTTTPISEPHNDPAYTISDWHQLLSPYGPTFTLITFAFVPLGVATSLWALKGLFMITSLAILLLVWKCAALLGRDRVRAIVLVGLNPIVLVWGLGGVHNDFLVMLALMIGFYLFLRDSPELIGGSWRESAGGARAVARQAGEPAAVPAGTLTRRLWAMLLPLSWPQVAGGAAFVLAASIKASAAVLVPVLLVALARRPRTMVQALIGMAVAGALLGAASLAAFGLHIPDLSTQSELVTQESVPNLIGLAIGVGGESEGVRLVMELALLASLIAACRYAWRRADAITPSAWMSIALLLTLSWVLPWYVLWVLPLAAISGSRVLQRASLLVGVYLIIAWAPASGLVWSAIDFHPQLTPLGRLHQRYIREILN